MSRLFFLVLFISMLSSCIRHSDDKTKRALLKLQTINSAIQSTRNAVASNLKALEDKSRDYQTLERASEYYPKAQIVYRLINTLINDVVVAAESSVPPIRTVQQLRQSAIQTIDAVVAIDSSVGIEFAPSITAIRSQIDAFIGDGQTRQSSDLFEASEWAENTRILQLTLVELANGITRYFDLKCMPFCGLRFDDYSPIINQNSTIFSPGQQLQIKAGIGAFSRTVQPEFCFNGKTIPLNEAGYSTYKERVPEQPGHYTVPVIISYFNQLTGERETATIKVEYDVKN